MIRTITVVSIYCLFGIIISLNANGQELRRRGSLGVQFSFINDSIAKADGCPLARVVAIICLASGGVLDAAMSPVSGKG